MSKLNMEPREMEAFREATKKRPIIFNNVGRQQVCPGCKRNRSITQFEGKKYCRACRGKK